MKLIERIQNIFSPSNKLPDGFVHNPDFDMVLLYELFGCLPSVHRESDNRTYIYFHTSDGEKLSVIRKMGFRPRRFKSHAKGKPELMYRAKVTPLMQGSAWHIVNKIRSTYYMSGYMLSRDVARYRSVPKYAEYVNAYKLGQKTK